MPGRDRKKKNRRLKTDERSGGPEVDLERKKKKKGWKGKRSRAHPRGGERKNYNLHLGRITS